MTARAAPIERPRLSNAPAPWHALAIFRPPAVSAHLPLRVRLLLRSHALRAPRPWCPLAPRSGRG
eukprot:12157354-Heterocapsa_arctica.AAC.1